jgi:hypothetical protein
MSKTREAGGVNKSSSKKDQPKGEAKEQLPELLAPPLTPRPKLFVMMAIVLVLLMAGLLTLYFKTVYPYRGRSHVIETDKNELPEPTR